VDTFLGKRLGDVARAAGHADLESRPAFEAVFDFYVPNQGDIGIITHYGNEPTVERYTMYVNKTLIVVYWRVVLGSNQ
jgi:hypothetical protein